MNDIESQLRSAMHAAVDAEQPLPDNLIRQVLRRHRRHSAIVAGTAVLVALAIAVPAAIALGTAIRATRPPPPVNHVNHGQHGPQPKLTGLPMPPGTNFELLTATASGAGWYSTATHRSKPIAGLPAGRDDGFGRVPGGWLASPVRVRSSCAGYFCAGPAVSFYFIADGAGRAIPVGTAIADHGVVAGSQASTFWLVTYPRSSDNVATTSANVRLVSPSGQSLGPHYALPAGHLLDRAVGSDLLLYPKVQAGQSTKGASGPEVFLLWDPRTGKVVRRLDNVMDATGKLIAWSPDCQDCRVQVLNVPSGKSVTTSLHSGSTPFYGAFSDDGALLAVQSSSALVVIDTATGSATVLTGTDLPSSSWENFGWQEGSHRLIITAGPGSDYSSSSGVLKPSQLAYWQPGDTSLRVGTVRNPAENSIIINGYAEETGQIS